jgi:glycosyltransferase involved in cell wall biosynthesis
LKRPDIAFYLATSGHSGVDRVMNNLVHEFVRLGYRVDILSIADHGPIWKDLTDTVRVIDLKARHVLTSFPRLWWYLLSEKPVSLLSDKDKLNRNAIIANLLSGKQTRITVRIGTTVSENLKKRRFLSRWSQYLSIRWLYRWAYNVITPSFGAAKDLAHLMGCPASKVTVANSPIIDKSFYERAAESIDHPWFKSNNLPVIFGLGELSERKNFAVLIQAFAKVREQIPCHLAIAGEGKQKQRLLELISELELEKEVHLLGYLDNPLPYLARSQVFCLTSRCEGMPVVLIEALACGVSVVSSDCPSGPKEILADGQYGILTPVNDVEALAQGILNKLQHPDSAYVLKSAVEDYTAHVSALSYLKALGFNHD